MSAFPKGEFLESVPLGIGDALLTSRPVMDGELVSAAVANRLPKTNHANTAYIHGLIKRFHNLSGEYLWQMPIEGNILKIIIDNLTYLDISQNIIHFFCATKLPFLRNKTVQHPLAVYKRICKMVRSYKSFHIAIYSTKRFECGDLFIDG